MKKITVILILLLAVGCQSANETIDGIFEGLSTFPKKNIRGEISKGIYTSPGKEFSVAVPNWSDKGEFHHMQMKEQFSETSQYVSFGPSRVNRNIYRVEFARVLSPESTKTDIEFVKEKIFSAYIGQVEKEYGTYQ